MGNIDNIPKPPKSQRYNAPWDGIERRKEKQFPLLQYGSKVYYSNRNKTENNAIYLYGDNISYRKEDYE